MFGRRKLKARIAELEKQVADLVEQIRTDDTTHLECLVVLREIGRLLATVSVPAVVNETWRGDA
jgi:hypothetical protein